MWRGGAEHGASSCARPDGAPESPPPRYTVSGTCRAVGYSYYGACQRRLCTYGAGRMPRADAAKCAPRALHATHVYAFWLRARLMQLHGSRGSHAPAWPVACSLWRTPAHSTLQAYPMPHGIQHGLEFHSIGIPHSLVGGGRAGGAQHLAGLASQVPPALLILRWGNPRYAEPEPLSAASPGCIRDNAARVSTPPALSRAASTLQPA